LDDLECPYDDLSKLEEEQQNEFKKMFMEKKVSKYHEGKGKLLETIFDLFIDILSKKVPVEGVTVKIDQILHKIRLVPIPDDVVYEDGTKIVDKVGEDGETQ